MGDVYIKLSADEKQAVDALQKLLAAQKGNEDGARKHGQAWDSMGKQAKSAADAATGGLASTLTGVGAVAAAVGMLTNLWSNWKGEVKEAAEEFKKMTADLASAVASMGQMKNFGAISLQVADVAKDSGLDMAAATKVWQASGGNMDVFRAAAAGNQMGMNSEQITDYARQIKDVNKASGGSLGIGTIADYLTQMRREKVAVGDEDVLSLKQAGVAGMEGGTREALAVLGLIKKGGADGGLLGKAADTVMRIRGQGVLQPSTLAPGTRELIADTDLQIEGHRRAETAFQAERKAAPGSEKMELDRREAELNAWGERLRERKTFLESQKTFTPAEEAHNALLALPELTQVRALVSQPEFAALMPKGQSKLPALHIDRDTINGFFAGAAGGQQREIDAAMSNPALAGMFEAQKAIAGADIDYARDERGRALIHTMGRAAISALTAEDHTKYKREQWNSDWDSAMARRDDPSDFGDDRFQEKFWAIVEKAKVLQTKAAGADDTPTVNIGNLPVRRIKPSRNAGSYDDLDLNAINRGLQ